MKFFIPLICVIVMTIAEPPVGDGYPAGRSSHDHGHDHGHDHDHDHAHDHENHIDHHDATHDHGSGFQRSPAQEYGAPSARTTFDSPSQEYGTPNTRSAHTFGDVGFRSVISQEIGAPSTRSGSLSQEYGPPEFRSTPSLEYIPAARGLSQEYGVPSSRQATDGYSAAPRDGLSQEYGVPSARNTAHSFARGPSSQYGVPELRSLISARGSSQGYVASTRTSSQNYLPPSSRSQFRSNSISQEYGVPRINQGYPSSKSAFRSSASRPHSAPASTVSRNFAGSSRSFGSSSNSLSTQYGLPASARTDSYLEGYKVSQSYGTPNQRSPAETYGAPSQGTVQEPAVIAARAGNLKTSAVASTFASRSSLSPKYNAPSIAAARNSMPSEQYGVPNSDLSGQGYNYARNALDDLINQEPANYDFAYKVSDLESGSDFGHTETRQDNRAEGTYFVLLPDGSRQVVEYEADEGGFKPRISVEPAQSRSGGYDDNAADLTRNNGGPY